MTLLMWVAVLVGVWCAASAAAAVVLGSLVRLRAHDRAGAAGPSAELVPGPLETGPMRLWLAGLPETEEPSPATGSVPGR